MGYDIIGDIHGHADELVRLLQKLGYSERSGTYRHPDRRAIFVGDIIDRGPQQLEALTIVRKMVDAGSALAVMGNHELNAIAWHTPDPFKDGEYIRRHSEGNLNQHKVFLKAVENNSSLHKEVIEWFLTLPLWLEFPEFRVIHACWHNECIATVTRHLDEQNRLKRASLPKFAMKPDHGNPEPEVYRAVEVLLKGPEISLPAGGGFYDKDGKKRYQIRVSWWNPSARTYKEAAVLSKSDKERLPDKLIEEHSFADYKSEKPVFFGHYWLTGAPDVRTGSHACVDYSVAQNGKLCAYRWDGSAVLTSGRFVTIP